MYKINILKENVDTSDIVYVLNEFEDKYLFNEKDMYHSGEWLYADVDYNDKIVKELLDIILVDVEEYRLENNKWYVHSEDKNIIGLSYLADYCREKFKTGIKYFNAMHEDDNDSDETYFYYE